MLIADGHHRYAVSRTYRDEVRAATGRDDTPAELTLAFVAELVADQLSVEAIHRLYADVDLDGAAGGARAALRPDADRRPRRRRRSRADGGRGLPRAGDRGRRLAADAAAGRVRRRPRPGRGLAGDGAEGRRPDGAYQHGLDAAARAPWPTGGPRAAVLVRPVSLAEIERTAREGLLMPPKSTFFTPKLKTGACCARWTSERENAEGPSGHGPRMDSRSLRAATTSRRT